MLKDKLGTLCNFILKYSKIAFPVIIIAAVAITVTIALNVGGSSDKQQLEQGTAETEAAPEVTEAPEKQEVPLIANEDAAITEIITRYYNALAEGDAETLNDVCDVISDSDMLHHLETAKYVESYPTIEIYTKAGLEEGTTIAYVYYKVLFANQEQAFPGYKAHYLCTDEQGQLYIKRGDNSEEVNEYFMNVSAQDDVVEFNNKITVEYNELMDAYPELDVYLQELKAQIATSVGVALAEQVAQEQENEAAGQEPEPSGEGGEQPPEQGTEQPPVEENVVLYASATTTVNVRASDSEQADKLGKVSGGTKLQVLEQRVNGWTKVLFEGKEGYIKSEFLQMTESAAGAESIGTVTATTNINVRSSASETADRLGVLAGGDSAELVAREDGWCKIKYQGQIGYVKADYVE